MVQAGDSAHPPPPPILGPPGPAQVISENTVLGERGGLSTTCRGAGGWKKRYRETSSASWVPTFSQAAPQVERRGPEGTLE